jgi:hypothetical protein
MKVGFLSDLQTKEAASMADRLATDKEIIRLWLRERRCATEPPPAPAELRLQLRRIAYIRDLAEVSS